MVSEVGGCDILAEGEGGVDCFLRHWVCAE